MPRCVVAALFLIVSLPSFLQVSAAEQTGNLIAARQALETARLKLQLYQREEHPRALHRLNREIELAEAVVDSCQRRVEEYEQFDKFKYSSPLFLTLEEARLRLLEAELALETLKEERVFLTRHHVHRLRLHQLEVDAAEQRVRQLQSK